jgi:hypothetical protein
LASAKLSKAKMQTRELNRATIELANNRDMSGRATAEEINGGLRTGKEKSVWRIASLIFLGSLTVAGLLVVVAPLPVRAANDEDSRHGREDNDRGIRAEITALQAQVASLQSTVSALQSQVNSLQTSNTGLQNQLAHAKNVLALDPFVSVDPNPEIGVIGPNITFSGANIHIVSGSGRTDDNGNPTGLGNLIIGYDEDPNIPLIGDSFPGLPIMQAAGFPTPLNSGDRGGSHNLIIGDGNRFTKAAFGGLVAGQRNTIAGFGASIGGGFNNTASGLFASVSAGVQNIASGEYASVTGGGRNGAGPSAGDSVSGGFENSASGPYATVSAGLQNTASDTFTSVSGGEGNRAGGFSASVTGGGGNTAGGFNTVVIGGRNVTDNKDNSIAPQPPFP